MRGRLEVLRRLLAVCLLLAAAAPAAGCAPARERALTLLGPWVDGEEKPFVETLHELEDEVGKPITYEGTRSLRETLAAQLEAGAPPDVVILSSPGDLLPHVRDDSAYSLPGNLAERAVSPWGSRLSSGGMERTYWLPVRVDLKSLVWTRAPRPGEVGRWCLGMSSGATSGWPGTDWIEDLLLHRSGADVYEDWATGRLRWTHGAVRDSWQAWGRVLTGKTGDRDGKALTTSFERFSEKKETRYGLLKRRGPDACTHEHQGSFIRSHYNDKVRPHPAAAYPDLTGREGGTVTGGVFEVSGDVAAVFRPSPQTYELLRALTSRDGRATWVEKAEQTGRTPLFPGPVAGRKEDTGSTGAVQEMFRDADELCLDASDAMPPTLRNAFHRAVLEFLNAPGDDERLEELLAQLERERLLQKEDGSFLLKDVCGSPS